MNTNTVIDQRASTLYQLTHQQEPSYTKVYWSVAEEIGINQALLLQVIEDWSQSNRRKNKRGYFHCGQWWTSGAYREWSNARPALGKPRTLQRLFLELEKKEYILSTQPNKSKGDLTKFYRVNSEKVGNLLSKEFSVVSKLDEPNDTGVTTMYIVPNPNTIVPSSNTIVPNLNTSQLETRTEQDFQPLNKIYPNIQPKPITEDGLGLKNEEELTTSYQDSAIKSNASCQDPVIQINPSLAKIPQDLATTSTSTHEDTLCGAARENNSQNGTVFTQEPEVFQNTVETTENVEVIQNTLIYTQKPEVIQSVVETTENIEVVQDTSVLTFSSDPLKETQFLAYFKTSIKRSRGTVIEKIYGYASKMLSNANGGAAELLASFNEWKKDCAALGRKISDVLEVEAIRQKEKCDFASWDRERRVLYYSRLLSEGLTRFCSHELSAKWYEWMLVNRPKAFEGVEIPA